MQSRDERVLLERAMVDCTTSAAALAHRADTTVRRYTVSANVSAVRHAAIAEQKGTIEAVNHP